MRFWNPARRGRTEAVRPLIGVLCCNEYFDRPVQTVASRFLEPIARIANADVLLVPASPDLTDPKSLAGRLDGLLLTGSRSHVAPGAYGGAESGHGNIDRRRDRMALSLASEMIEASKPVFGICRGLQELNVLFGGTLRGDLADSHKHPAAADIAFEELFGHRHSIDLVGGGVLAPRGPAQIAVNSVHEQGVDRLGSGLRIEAVESGGSLVEGFSSQGCGAPVLAVQWHPECDTETCSVSRSFFEILGTAAARSLQLAA